MIVSKDYPAAAGQSKDRLFEKRIIPFVGEQPYPGRLRQQGAGLVSQHKQAYRDKLGERE